MSWFRLVADKREMMVEAMSSKVVNSNPSWEQQVSLMTLTSPDMELNPDTIGLIFKSKLGKWVIMLSDKAKKAIMEGPLTRLLVPGLISGLGSGNAVRAWGSWRCQDPLAGRRLPHCFSCNASPTPDNCINLWLKAQSKTDCVDEVVSC